MHHLAQESASGVRGQHTDPGHAGGRDDRSAWHGRVEAERGDVADAASPSHAAMASLSSHDGSLRSKSSSLTAR